MSEGPGPIVVCDAGPLIHLDELTCLDLLADFPAVLVPAAVWEEVERHRPTALVAAGVQLHRVQAPTAASPEVQALARLLALHRGEIEALTVAAANPGSLLLTDDTAARLAATSLRMTAHGTLGLLLRGLRRGRRTKEQLMTTLRELPSASTLHLKRSLLDEVLRQVDEWTGS